MCGRFQKPALRIATVLEGLKELAMASVDTWKEFFLLGSPRIERRRVVLHGPIRPREIERHEMDAFAGKVASEFMDRCEFGLDIHPEFMLGFGEHAPGFWVLCVAEGKGVDRFP